MKLPAKIIRIAKFRIGKIKIGAIAIKDKILSREWVISIKVKITWRENCH